MELSLRVMLPRRKLLEVEALTNEIVEAMLLVTMTDGRLATELAPEFAALYAKLPPLSVMVLLPKVLLVALVEALLKLIVLPACRV